MLRLLFVVGCATVYGSWGATANAKPQGPIYRETDPFSLLRGIVRERFVPVAWDELPSKVRSNAQARHSCRFENKAGPIEVAGVVIEAAAAGSPDEDDLLRYTWGQGWLEFRLIEGLNALVFEIKVAAVTEDLAREHGFETPRELIIAEVEKMLRLKGPGRDNRIHVLTVPWPDKLSSGARFSSAPDTDLNEIWDWRDRVDGEIVGGWLRLTMPERIPRYPGYRNGATWFPDDFRELVQEKAREQGRLSPDTRKSQE